MLYVGVWKYLRKSPLGQIKLSKEPTLQCRIADPGRQLFFREKNHRGSLLFGWGRFFFLDKKLKGSFSRGIFEAVFTHFYQNIVINNHTFPLQLILMYLGVAYLDGVGKYFFQKMYGGGRLFGRGRQFGTIE